MLARYDLEEAARTMAPGAVRDRRGDMWRYEEVLPARREPVSLGEGMTPLVDLPSLAGELRLASLAVKDEAVNPTGSFKARGLSAAVTVARERGVERGMMPSAGNAGSALAAYGARAGFDVELYLPRDTPGAFLSEARLHGARVHLVDGTIAECGKQMRENAPPGSFDFSTLREPYRIEGKKTMAYELWEQTSGDLPDVLIYPTGGGTGLIGMWKAFSEMRALGWPFDRAPRMVSVQAAGCAPIVAAFASGASSAGPWPHPHTAASGLRVPSAIGDFLILGALRDSGGTAVAVSDEDLLAGARELARRSGILACPEGGAALAGLRACLERGDIREGERVVIFNTGSGLKYLDCLDTVGERAA
jgi:threonine synthase